MARTLGQTKLFVTRTLGSSSLMDTVLARLESNVWLLKTLVSTGRWIPQERHDRKVVFVFQGAKLLDIAVTPLGIRIVHVRDLRFNYDEMRTAFHDDIGCCEHIVSWVGDELRLISQFPEAKHHRDSSQVMDDFEWGLVLSPVQPPPVPSDFAAWALKRPRKQLINREEFPWPEIFDTLYPMTA